MQLPEQLLPYESPTLVFVCDRANAAAYQANDREVNLLESHDNERLGLEDVEREQVAVGGDRFAKASDEGMKEREAKMFYKSMAQDLFDHLKKGEFEELILVVPGDDKNFLIEELHAEVSEKLVLTLPKQLTKVSQDELFERVDQARRAE